MRDDHGERLADMEAWYASLIGSGSAEAERAFLEDYAPHADFLGGLRGRVIDIGGGAGVAARFLDPAVDYVVVDPSPIWSSKEWKTFSARFRQSGPKPRFVEGVGEALPFSDGEFDAALSIWSLNHAQDPARCIEEMARVLRRSGRARIVVDDVEPIWSDLIADGLARVHARLRGSTYRAKIPKPLLAALRAKLSGRWPVHEDHLPIAEADLLRWVKRRMQVDRIQWLAGSLTLDLVNRR
jgi:SAM-dependent methyltransferase